MKKGKTMRNEAISILEESDSPLGPKEIYERILMKDNWIWNEGVTPRNTLALVLSQGEMFHRVERGKYMLKDKIVVKKDIIRHSHSLGGGYCLDCPRCKLEMGFF